MFRSSLLFLTLAGFSTQLDAQILGLRFTQGSNVSILNDGSTIAMNSDAINTAVNGTLAIQYRGTQTNISINSIEILGSQDFTVVSDAPLTLGVNGTTTVGVKFLPSSSNRANARLVINYQEVRTVGSVTLNLTGFAPEFAFSFTPPQGNATPLTNGGNIVFPQTPIDQIVSASVAVINRGTAPGLVRSISGTANAAFQFVGLPLPSTSVDPGQTLRFSIQYQPKVLDRVTGQGTIELFDQKLAFTFEGSGTRDLYSYEVIREGGGVSPIQPDALITLPDALVGGDKTQIIVRFRNTGNVDGRVPAINIAGAAFSLAEVPFTPLTLTPGQAASLTIAFTPKESGRTVGKLRIGNDSFDLAGNGLAPVLTYSFTAANVTTTVLNSGSVIFAPVAVGSTGRLTFEVANTGSAPTTLNSVSLGAVNTGFDLENLPPLPQQLAAGATARFAVTFAPTVVGAASTTLRVDTAAFTLTAAATQPPPLPAYHFDGATGNQAPLAQPAVGLLLDRPYPLALTGTLTLAFNSDVFSNDPAVQYAVGGRTINFTIPANSTRAVFSNGAQQVRLQTGTVAGNITLTPSFVTDGGINLTPTRPDFLTLTIPASGPQLLNAVLATKTATGISLLLTGYAPTRSLTQIDLQFTPVAGENVPTTRLSLNVEASFNAWYSSGASIPFGSNFSVTIPLTITGDVKNVTSPTDTISSISVTIQNRNGTTAARTIEIK